MNSPMPDTPSPGLDEIERLRKHAQAMSDALIKVRPLGGSELFVRVGDQFYADSKYCGDMIEQILSDRHKTRAELADCKLHLHEVVQEAGFQAASLFSNALDRAASRASRLEEELKKARAVLWDWTKWEADIIENADWRNSLPRLTQGQMDALTPLQERRNDTVARIDAALAEEEDRPNAEGD